VVEAGGGLRAYQVAGADVVDGYAEEELCPAGRGQILAPWPHRIRDGRYDFSGSTPVGTDGTPLLVRTTWTVGSDGLRAAHAATNVGPEA